MEAWKVYFEQPQVYVPVEEGPLAKEATEKVSQSMANIQRMEDEDRHVLNTRIKRET